LVPVQTGPGAHPTSCTMGTVTFSGVKSCRGVTLIPHPFYCHGQERVELYFYLPYGPYGLYRSSVPVQGRTLPFYLEEQQICTSKDQRNICDQQKPVYTHTHTHTYIHTYIHTCTHTHTHTHTHINTYTRTHTYIHMHTHTYIHYIHTY